MKIHAFRVKPNQDLRVEIDKFVLEKEIKSGCILTCVGNLKKAIVRMADTQKGKPEPIIEITGPLEIVSLVGTVESGNSHIHISVSDRTGMVTGGHLKNGSIIGVTAEIVIGEFEDIKFTRELDIETGYEELVVTNLANKF